MARHRKHRQGHSRFDIHNQTRRDDLSIASDLSDRVFEPVSRSLPSPLVEDFLDNYSSSVRSLDTQVEDRRTYTPAGRSARPPASSRRHLAKTKPTKLTAFAQQAIQTFAHPKSVLICLRRKMREEVLHALGKSGKGSRFQKKPKYNQHSNIRCR